jgi:ABC-type Fe3+/spermidine/putrescine transport system ATPase subunit
MLDEPLTSLDRTLRERLMNELRDILTRVGQTAIYVTHDQQEAFALADQVVILNAGRVAQIGSPQEVYCHPADAFVARFLGLTNLFDGKWAAQAGGARKLETALGVLTLPEAACQEGAVTVLIRPDAAMLGPQGQAHPSDIALNGILVERSFRGVQTRIVVRVNEITLEFEMDLRASLPPVGSPIRLVLRPDAVTCLPA